MRALGHVNIRKQQCIEMFREVDKDPASSLNFDEFCKVMRSRMPKKDPYEEAKKIFELFDADKTGKITFKTLKKISTDVGENFSDKELQEMIQEGDKNGDSMIDFNEFYKIMKKKCNDPLNEFDSDSGDDYRL